MGLPNFTGDNLIPTLNFICHINEVLNSLLFNKRVKITAQNIGNIETYLRTKLVYFAAWSHKMKEQKDSKEPHWDLTGFSTITMRNLWISF